MAVAKGNIPFCTGGLCTRGLSTITAASKSARRDGGRQEGKTNRAGRGRNGTVKDREEYVEGVVLTAAVLLSLDPPSQIHLHLHQLKCWYRSK